jgi:hypothetical protein
VSFESPNPRPDALAQGMTPGVTKETAQGTAQGIARGLARGVVRLFDSHGFACVTEFTLANGRRADVMALGPAGEVHCVEIKTSLPDFRADAKWPDYLDYCDAFFFAVPADFPLEVLPGDCGLVVADAYGGEFLRGAPPRKLNAARRKAVTLRFGLTAARRLGQILDPP